MTNLAAGAVSAADPTLASFYPLVWWIIAIKVVVLFLFLLLFQILMIWAERRVIGRMQNRPGPNRWGPFGLLQPLADALKLPLKEDIVPRQVDKLLFFLAPVLAAVPALISFAIIPFGPIVSIFGVQTPLQLTDLPVAVLLVLAMSSIGVYGIVLAGWSSMSPYSLLGGLRSSAQVISYEIAMAPVLRRGLPVRRARCRPPAIVNAAGARSWYVWMLLPSFLIYLFCMVGETNRLPFDLPEGEGELVGGYHTEYSSLRFTLMYLAEYVNMLTVSALATTLFLGGWRAPWPMSAVVRRQQRLVADHLVPDQGRAVRCSASSGCAGRCRGSATTSSWRSAGRSSSRSRIVWLLLIATVRAWRYDTHNTAVYAVGGVVLAIIIVIAVSWDIAAERRASRAAEAESAALEAEPEPGGTPRRRPGGRMTYPVPPLDLPHYHGVGVTGAASPAGPAPRQPRWLARVTPTAPRRSPVLDFLNPVKGFGVTFHEMFRKVDTVAVPGGEAADRAAFPRPSPAQPLARRPGEVHRLRAVRLGLPRRRDLRRGRRQHPRSATPRASGTGTSTRSTTCAASSAACASRRARPGR